MKRVVLTGLVMLTLTPVFAQDTMDDGSRVILPLETQQCRLPYAPPPIDQEPVYADLIAAQKKVKAFQSGMEKYRECLNHDLLSDVLSDGNRQAITNAHNYSVDMEERVAEMFNVAVRAYKASQAKD